jgi:tetratricopeptide (TPR) repeat protein
MKALADAEAHLNVGNALARQGRLIEARSSVLRALELRPDLAEARTNLAELQLELGEIDGAAASCRRALTDQPQLARAHRILGEALARQGRHREALERCREALALEPAAARTHILLGYCLAKLARPDEALVALTRALELDPHASEAQFRCAQVCRSLGRLEQAESGYRRALELKPGWLAAHIELATVLRLQGRSSECELQCRMALALDAGACDAWLVLAELRADEGRFVEAEELFKRAIALDADCIAGWAGIARIRRMTWADEEWLSAALRLAGAARGARELPLYYALGKYFDDVGEAARAFEHYRRANELAKRCGPRHERSHLTRATGRLMRCQSSAWLRQAREAREGSDRAVFVIGMPRSGTSLIEQILASHPEVHGAGEITFWGARAAEVLMSSGSMEAVALERDAPRLVRLGHEYLDILRRRSTSARRVVNKWPTNFWFTGTIHAALPGARFIHVRRHPIDTCLSIYFQHFEAANAYANDLEDLAEYYRDYTRLMHHWRGALPRGRLLELNYEELVTDPAAATRRMLEFLELPWEARCLDFHQYARSVITASRWQVRQPLYTGSIGRWERYARFLGPLASLAPQACA